MNDDLRAMSDDLCARLDRVGRKLDACIVMLGLTILADVVMLATDCAR